MIHENIRAARRQSGLSQEEVAAQCHVVRQTVAKWESGRSLPDARTLSLLADALNVPVMQLLGLPNGEADDLRREVDALQEKQRLMEKAGRARGIILMLCFAAMLIAFRAGESLVGMLAVGVCLLSSLAVLWRHLETLTFETSPGAELSPVRIVTIVTASVVAGVILLTVLMQARILSVTETAEKAFVMLLVAGMMGFFGWIAPKLPFNRHTGLRLPWTVADAETWYLAHRIMGWISLPAVLLYIASVCIFADTGLVTLAALAVYIGVPGGVSFLFYWRKLKGRAPLGR